MNPSEKIQLQISSSSTALTEKKYRTAIDASTEALHEVIGSQVVQLLSIRCIAYEKEGLLSRALGDALSIIEYAPASFLGYLRAGDIHLANGKPGVAADCYEYALKFAPESHSQYRHIQDQHGKAILRDQTRFDLVGNLPLELLQKILVYLQMEDIWVCVTVSQKWCNVISQSGSWWNTVALKRTDTHLDKVICDAISLTKDHIKQLVLVDDLSVGYTKRYMGYLKNGGFKHLKALSLKEKYCRNMEPEDFAIALWQIRDTLTSLKLEFGGDKSYRLLNILATCANLEYLSYVTSGDITLSKENENYISETVCKKLIHLELRYRNISYHALSNYITVCPNLRRLVIEASGEDPLGNPGNNMLTTCCPKLKMISINYPGEIPDIGNCEYSTEEKGVMYMAVKFNNQFSFQQSGIHVNAQATSLRELNIIDTSTQQPNYYGYYTNENPLSSEFCNLRKLGYTFTSNYYTNSSGYTATAEIAIRNLIQSSPQLSNLSLLHLTPRTNFRTSVEKAVKIKIQVLTLKELSFQDTAADWYRSFLSSLDHVHTLKIQACDFLNDDVISSLAASESVQELTIAQCKNISNAGLTEFLKQITLRPSHRLQTLILDSLSATLDIPSTRLIVKIKSLRTLKVINDKNFSTEIVNDLINQAPYSTLRTIEILDCFTSDVAKSWSDSVSRLKESGVSLAIA